MNAQQSTRTDGTQAAGPADLAREDGARIAEVAPVDLQRRTSETDMAGRLRAVDGLDALIQRATWARGYIGARCSLGTDSGHEAGVREANKALFGVRKVLGYSYPAAAAISV
jgi:hypothetical protein